MRPPPSLPTSPDADPEQLRVALEEMARHNVAEWEAEPVARVAAHSDPEIRSLALRALASQPAAAAEAIRERLQDPIDDVRAEAVRAAGGDPQRLVDVIPALVDRRWPAAQAEALRVFPDLLARSSLPDDELPTLARAVSDMPTSPVAREREAFGEIARTIGVPRLANALRAETHARLGLARLLLVEGSVEALRAVATLAEDADPDLRSIGSAAVGLLTPEEAEVVETSEPSPPPPDRGPATPVAFAPGALRALAEDLRSPDPAVRDRALAGLGDEGWQPVLKWAREALRGEDDREASLAATVAERLLLRQVAPLLLERAAELPAEERGPYLRALSVLGSEGEWLTGLLLQIDPPLRPTAMGIVWEIAGREFLRHLSAALPGMPLDLRRAIPQLAVIASDPEPMELAFSLLLDDLVPAVRADAVRALAGAGPRLRFEALERALADPAPEIRRLALEHLTPPGGEADRLLIAALDDPDDEVANAALPRLAERLSSEPATVWSALRRTTGLRRTRLEEALAATGRERLLRLAEERLRSLDVEDRVLATRLILDRRPEQATPTAARLLADPSPVVRTLAVGALHVGSGDERAAEALRLAAADPTPEVRAEALRAFAEQPEEWCIGLLIDALGDPSEEVRDVASEVLRAIGSRGLARRLIAALRRRELLPEAVDLLAGMGRFIEDLLVEAAPASDRDARRTIGGLLEETVGLGEYARRLTSLDRDQRSRAVDAIAAIGSSQAIGLLARVLEDPDERIRLQAVRWLGEASDARAVEALRAAAELDPVAEVVDAARDALRRIGADVETQGGTSGSSGRNTA